MKLRNRQNGSQQMAYTLVEVMVALSIGALLLAAVCSLSLYGARSFAAIENYASLDARSQHTLDTVSRSMRQATALVGFETNLPTRFLLFTNSLTATCLKLTYDSVARTLTCEETGLPPAVCLTGCDRWDFNLFQKTGRMSGTNMVFFPATNYAGQLDPRFCKLVNMSWKCSRTIVGKKLNTETIQTAQVVLRNN